MSRLARIAVVVAASVLAAPTFAAPQGKPVYGTFGFDTAGMDLAVRPGDDFYSYASGVWQRTTEIPANSAQYGMFKKLQDLSMDRTRLILEAAATRPGDKAGDFYASFMDETRADANGIAPVVTWLREISSAQNKDALAGVMARLQRAGVKSVFSTVVKQDDRRSTLYVARILQGGIGLPDRDYYLKDDPKLAQIRGLYPAYLAKLLTLAGEGDAAARAIQIAAFESQLAQSHWTRVESRDVEKTYNEWRRADFDAKAPGFEWSRYLSALGLAGEKRLLVNQPSALTGEAGTWASTPLPVLKDYLIVHVLMAYGAYLSKPFVEANFAFTGTALAGTPEDLPRWKRGVSLVSAKIGDAVATTYVQRYFPPEAKVEADRLVRNIIASYRQRLQTVPWLAPETRVKAVEKLDAFTPEIGYPAKWRNYSALRISRTDLVGNVARAEAFEYQRNLNHLGQPIDRSEWLLSTLEVNAFVDFGLNKIVFPAAILQPPFFDPNADPAVNYGGIGMVIGHELSHHFDDQGRKYDKTGKLMDWWTPQDATRFASFTKRLVHQYDNYEPIAGLHIQGALTLGENLADDAGLTIAYQAYQISLGGRPAPLIDGFTGDQRFYLGFAQIWRSKSREAQLRRQLLTNLHAPDIQRTYEVRNQDPWYTAFDVRAGDKLYLSPADRVQIW